VNITNGVNIKIQMFDHLSLIQYKSAFVLVFTPTFRKFQRLLPFWESEPTATSTASTARCVRHLGLCKRLTFKARVVAFLCCLVTWGLWVKMFIRSLFTCFEDLHEIPLSAPVMIAHQAPRTVISRGDW